MRDGARTTVLSKFWRPLWQRAPLDLDDCHLISYKQRGDIKALARITGKIGDDHQGRITRLSLSFLWHYAVLDKFVNWCRQERLRLLGKLELDFTGGFYALRHTPQHNDVLLVPMCAFELPVVRSVTLANCFIRVGSVFSSQVLNQLEFRNVKSHPGAIEHIIQKSRNVETLLIIGSCGSKILRIDDMECLRRLFIVLSPDAAVEDYDTEEGEEILEVSEISVQNNRSLEQIYVTQNVYGPSMTISGAPMLKFCGCFGWVNRSLYLDHSHFFRTEATNLVSQLASVKTFCLQLIRPDLHPIRDFLECFPCLETLHIQHISEAHDNYPASVTATELGLLLPSHQLRCVEQTLRRVVLWGYIDPPADVCNFFLTCGKVLESVTLVSSTEGHKDALN